MASETFTFYVQPWYRKSPYSRRPSATAARAGACTTTCCCPTLYEDPVAEYRALLNDVTLWDVRVERCVEVTRPRRVRADEPDRLPRSREGATSAGPVRAVTAPWGGIVNDPVLLRLAEDRFWLALADSDALLSSPASRGLGVSTCGSRGRRLADAGTGPSSKDVDRRAVRRRGHATSATTGAPRPRSTASRWSLAHGVDR